MSASEIPERDVAAPEDWSPKFVGQRPPFGVDTSALKHGAHSERVVTPLAERTRSVLVAQGPWLGAEMFTDALDSLSRTAAKFALIHNYLHREGILDEKGRPRPAAMLPVSLRRASGGMPAERMRTGPPSPSALARYTVACSSASGSCGNGPGSG